MKQLHSESQRLVRGQFHNKPFSFTLFQCVEQTLVVQTLDRSIMSCSSVSVESMLGLPYHVPEPKTIDQVFKKRARPAGPAMALLK